jgi:hypothetical protein
MSRPSESDPSTAQHSLAVRSVAFEHDAFWAGPDPRLERVPRLQGPGEASTEREHPLGPAAAEHIDHTLQRDRQKAQPLHDDLWQPGSPREVGVDVDAVVVVGWRPTPGRCRTPAERTLPRPGRPAGDHRSRRRRPRSARPSRRSPAPRSSCPPRLLRATPLLPCGAPVTCRSLHSSPRPPPSRRRGPRRTSGARVRSPPDDRTRDGFSARCVAGHQAPPPRRTGAG